jgi:hypothetical protein
MPGALGDQQGSRPAEPLDGRFEVVVVPRVDQLGGLVAADQHGHLRTGGARERLGHVHQQWVAGDRHDRPRMAPGPGAHPVEPVDRVRPLDPFLVEAGRCHRQHDAVAA